MSAKYFTSPIRPRCVVPWHILHVGLAFLTGSKYAFLSTLTGKILYAVVFAPLLSPDGACCRRLVARHDFLCALPLLVANMQQHRKEIMKQVDQSLGAIARPKTIYFVSMLPKTRSGKLLRRSIQAIAEGRDPGDLTTLEDLAAIEEIIKVTKP